MKVRIEWVYQPNKGKMNLTFTSEYDTIENILYIANDIERTGRVKDIRFSDENDSTWQKKELLKYIQKIEEEPHDIVATFDGGFDISSKIAGVGIVIYYKKDGERFRIRKNERLEQLDSNNEAEYAALAFLLKELELLGVHHQSVTIKGDSLVVINQLKEEWPCYEEDLRRWLDKIVAHIAKLGLSPTFEDISRKDNKEADQLATQALQHIVIDSHMKIDKKAID